MVMNDASGDRSAAIPQLAVIATDASDERVRLAVAGEIDMSTAHRFEEALTQAFGDRRSGVLEVDLGEVDFMDSAGLRTLVRWHTRAQVQGCRLVVTNAQEIVRRVLQMSGLLDLLLHGDQPNR